MGELLISGIECMGMGAGGVRQTKMHTAEPFVPEPSTSEAEAAVGKLKSYKAPGVDQIQAGWKPFILRSMNLLR
jgi:hypothetical protein